MTQPKFPTTISNSKLEDAACFAKFHQKYILNLVSDKRSIHLCYGGAFAAGLAETRFAFFINGSTEEDALASGLRAILKEWDIEELQLSKRSSKNIFSCCVALQDYLRQFPLASSQPQPMRVAERGTIEFDFALPIPVNHPETGEPILYSGRCDMLGGDPLAPDYIFIVDEKTANYLGDEWPTRMRLKGQLMGYVWAAREHGYKVLAAFVRGISPKQSGQIDFAETTLWYHDHQLDRWHKSMVTKIKRLVQAFKEDDWPYDFSHTCTQFNAVCPYADRCMARDPNDIPGFITRTDPHWTETW